jgi:cytochrome c oxidase assembly protein subunit 11
MMEPMPHVPTQTDLTRRHRHVAGVCVGVGLVMLGAAFAAVPLYQLFCQVTGYAGTTQRAIVPSNVVVDQMMRVRFDAHVAPGLPWTFEPVQRVVDVKLGENTLAFYRVTNTSDRITKGTATYNVTPDQAGIFFNKVACFCFTEQTLAPGQSIEMPVSFFVDPALATDKDNKTLKHLTLSYTFFPVGPAKPGT